MSVKSGRHRLLGRKSVGVLRRAEGGRRGGQRVGAVASEGRGTRKGEGEERGRREDRRGEDRIGEREERREYCPSMPCTRGETEWLMSGSG
jgi:hypothetical protein